MLSGVALPYVQDTITCNTFLITPRPFVPLNFHRVVFNTFHSISQPVVRATQRLITVRFVWPRVNADVPRWTRSCQTCQHVKVTRHTWAALREFRTAACFRFSVPLERQQEPKEKKDTQNFYPCLFNQSSRIKP